jgi:hypothetical protein
MPIGSVKTRTRPSNPTVRAGAATCVRAESEWKFSPKSYDSEKKEALEKTRRRKKCLFKNEETQTSLKRVSVVRFTNHVLAVSLSI